MRTLLRVPSSKEITSIHSTDVSHCGVANKRSALVITLSVSITVREDIKL